MRRELAPKHWLHVNGTIKNVYMAERTTGEPCVGKVCIPAVEYVYQYNGQTFKSTRRRACNYVAGNKISAAAISSRYPVGSSVKVLINPGKPALSALEYGTSPLSWILIGLGAFLTGCGILPFFLK